MDPTPWPSDWLNKALAENDRYPLEAAKGGFQLEIDLLTPDDPLKYAELASRWLTTVVGALGAPPVAGLTALPALPDKSLARHRGGFGAPGSQWGQVIVNPADRRRQGSLYAWSPRAFDRLLGRLPENPLEARIEFSSLDEHGSPGAGGHYVFSVARDYPGFQGLTRLVAYRSAASFADDRGSAAEGWADLLTSYLGSLGTPVAYAHLAVNMKHNDFRTPSETNAGTFAEEVLPNGRLRGHEWITVIGERAVGRVGGADGLRAAGAFARVEAMSHGEVLVQAADDLADYTDEVRSGVAAALVAVLPAR